MSEELVPTPGGYRLKSQVHQVEPGNILRLRDNHIQKLDTSNAVVANYEKVDSSSRRPLLRGNASVTTKTIPESKKELPAPAPNWITFAYWSNGTSNPISSFKTTWVVPPPPTTQSVQLIYLFNGIENAKGDLILQPVLQWGASPIGGGKFWAVASWFVNSSGIAFKSKLVRVNPGDNLVGLISLTGQKDTPAGTTYDYNCIFHGIADTSLEIHDIQQLKWCSQTLEAYNITKCSDYPNTTKTRMTAIDIQTGGVRPTITWTIKNRITDCGQTTTIISDSSTNGQVNLCYRRYYSSLKDMLKARGITIRPASIRSIATTVGLTTPRISLLELVERSALA
jgi:hypothetical protein